jgi:sodium/hydrogen exchanger-like protein 6/7/sodium/hydrogen exchanger 8
MFEIISICSLLCSSDVIAAISMINYKDQPKLFSIVYGEGVFNDIVSIILFNTVSGLRSQDFTPSTPFTIIGNFIVLAASSLAIGLVFGILSSFLFKYARFLCHSAITETILLLLIAFIGYYISESLQFSGIISLLACGISMAHYTWYNLSPQGKTISSVTFSILGSIAESIVFAYIGLCVFTYSKGKGAEEDDNYYWSFSFIIWMTVIVIVGRIAAVFTAHGLFSLCQKKKDITIRELGFISYGGMIRGAIAFGLVLKISPLPNAKGEKFRERGVIVTTTLALVIITTVLFGSFMPVV